MLLLLTLAFGDRPAALLTVLETSPPTDPLSALLTYGPLGILVILISTGQLRTKFEVQRLEKENERLRQDGLGKDELIRAFQIQLTGHTLPALAQSARVFEAIPTAGIDELARVRDEAAALAKQIEALSKGLHGDNG